MVTIQFIRIGDVLGSRITVIMTLPFVPMAGHTVNVMGICRTVTTVQFPLFGDVKCYIN